MSNGYVKFNIPKLSIPFCTLPLFPSGLSVNHITIISAAGVKSYTPSSYYALFITTQSQILLTISKPIINLTTLHLSHHTHCPSHLLFSGLPMICLLLFLLLHRAARVILSNCISGYVALLIKPRTMRIKSRFLSIT